MPQRLNPREYSVEEAIEGGMARVLKARHLPTGEIRAIKVLKDCYADKKLHVERFHQEAAITRSLSHRNIVKVYDEDCTVNGPDHRTHFFVMEFVDGVDLRFVLKAARERGLSLPVGFVLHVMEGLLGALEHAQNLVMDGEPRPVVHRDVSPHNLLIWRAGEVKLSDFGLAKARGATSATRTGVLKGKLAYLSPEQASGGEVGTASDLFCAGIVMWEMLAGRRLFSGANEQEILARAMNAEVEPIPWLAGGLCDFMGRLLAKAPSDRYSSAREWKE